MYNMTFKRMFISALFSILKILKQCKSSLTGQWRRRGHCIAVSLLVQTHIIKKDAFEKPKLSEKNQIFLIYHLHPCLKHTKQYCLLFTDLNICEAKHKNRKSHTSSGGRFLRGKGREISLTREQRGFSSTYDVLFLNKKTNSAEMLTL